MSGIQANVRLAPQICPGGRRAVSLLNFIFIFCGSGVVYIVGDGAALRHSTQESAMKFVFIMAIMLFGITTAQGQISQGQTAQGQNVLQPNGQTTNGETAVGSDALNGSTSSSASVSSPATASQSGTASGSPTVTGS